MTYFRRDITHNASNGRGTNVLKSSLATVYGCATRSQGVSVTFGTPSVSYAYTDSGRLSSAVLSDGTAFAYFYHPALMRWLNRDPIGESGDSNQYLFVRNIPLQKVDAKGLYWQIKRNGGIFAYATPTENNDTFEILARKLRLDMIDYKIWAHTSDVKPHRCKKYKIPNLVVYDSGGRRFVDKLPLNVINIWRWQNEKRAASDCKNGFMVLVRDNVSSKQIESILRIDGLYRYTFTGHGDGEAGINAYPDPLDAVSPVERYTKYGISSMVLQTCGSAAIDGYSEDNHKAGIVKHNNWELNVAKAGFFIGYEGAVTLLNELFQWTVTKGANYGTSD